MAKGGKRVGAGRPAGSKNRPPVFMPPPPQGGAVPDASPAEFLAKYMKDIKNPDSLRLDAAKALLPYCHRKLPVAVEHSGRDGQALPASIVVEVVAPPVITEIAAGSAPEAGEEGDSGPQEDGYHAAGAG